MLIIIVIFLCVAGMYFLSENLSRLQILSGETKEIIRNMQSEVLLLGIRAKSDELIWHKKAWAEEYSNIVSLREFISLMYPPVSLNSQNMRDIYFVIFNDELIVKSNNITTEVPSLLGDVLYIDFYFDGVYYWNQIEISHKDNQVRILYALDPDEYYPASINELYYSSLDILSDISGISNNILAMVVFAMVVIILSGIVLVYLTKTGSGGCFE